MNKEKREQYLNSIYSLAGSIDKNPSLNSLRKAVILTGNAEAILSDSRLNKKFAFTQFAQWSDVKMAIKMGLPQKEVEFVAGHLKDYFFDLLHSITHIISGARQNPEGEMLVTGGYIGFLGMRADDFIVPYVANISHNLGKWPIEIDKLKKVFYESIAPEYNINTICKHLNNIREQYKNWYMEPPYINDHPIKLNISSNDFALNHIDFLESVTRSFFAKNKIVKASKYGIDLFTDENLQINLLDIPAHTVYFSDIEVDISRAIAEDKKITPSRLPYTSIEIKDVKESVAKIRHEIAKIL